MLSTMRWRNLHGRLPYSRMFWTSLPVRMGLRDHTARPCFSNLAMAPPAPPPQARQHNDSRDDPMSQWNGSWPDRRVQYLKHWRVLERGFVWPTRIPPRKHPRPHPHLHPHPRLRHRRRQHLGILHRVLLWATMALSAFDPPLLPQPLPQSPSLHPKEWVKRRPSTMERTCCRRRELQLKARPVPTAVTPHIPLLPT